MGKEPEAAGFETRYHSLSEADVLKPEDLLSDPAGENLFLPADGETPVLYPPEMSETSGRDLWADVSAEVRSRAFAFLHAGRSDRRD